MRKYYLLVTTTVCLLAHFNNSFAQKSESVLYQQTSEINNLMVQHDADDKSIKHILFIKNSPERRERLKKLEQSYLIELAKIDYDKLPVGSRVDYILFKRNLANELRLLVIEEKDYNQIAIYIPFADSIYTIEKRRRRGATIDAQKFATQLHTIQLQTTNLLQQLAKDTTLNMAICNRAAATVTALQDALKNVFDFYNAYNPEFTWWIPIPYKATDSILTMYASAFREKSKATSTQKNDASGIVGNPIGREEILAQLQYEMIAYSPEELIAIANKEFAW